MYMLKNDSTCFIQSEIERTKMAEGCLVIACI